jgi:hypothetical protein
MPLTALMDSVGRNGSAGWRLPRPGHRPGQAHTRFERLQVRFRADHHAPHPAGSPKCGDNLRPSLDQRGAARPRVRPGQARPLSF